MKPRSVVRRSFPLVAGPALSLLVAFATLEIVLRLVPRAIPPAVLAEFPAGLRSTVARNLPVTTRDQMRKIVRDDGGPELLVYRPSVEVHAYAPDPGMVENVRVDSEGFCDPLPDPEGPAKLVVVGDSFTFCTTVHPEETWTASLGRRLHLPAEDLGVPRVGVYEYLEILKQVGLPKRPDVVVMNVYEGNDLRDAVLYWETRNRDGARSDQVEPPSERVGRAIRASRFGRHSYALSLVSGALLAWNKPSDVSELARREGRKSRDVNFRYDLDFGGSTIAFNAENADRNEVVYADLLARARTSLDVFRPALEEYAALSRAHHFTPVLSYTPSAYTAYAGFVRFEDPALDPLLRTYSQVQRAYFARTASELGLEFVDLTEPLRSAARTLRERSLLYFPRNLHLTAAGHDAIARALADVLGSDGASGTPVRSRDGLQRHS